MGRAFNGHLADHHPILFVHTLRPGSPASTPISPDIGEQIEARLAPFMRKAILDTRVLIAEDLGAAPAPLVLAHPKLHCSAEGCASLPDWLGVRPRLLIYDGVTSRGATTPCAGRRWLEVSYVPDDGAEHRVPLAQARAVPLEQGLPVRRFTSRKGQRHLSGLRWSATTSGHAGFESWLAHDHVLPLDFDPSVLGIASQPFWLH